MAIWDSCWYIPTLRAQADQLADQVADLSPEKMAIWDSYWYIPTLRVQADQLADQVPDLTPPGKWQFDIHTNRFLPWELRQIKFQIYLQENDNLRFILIDSYSESPGRPVGRSSGRSTTIDKWQFEIHTHRFLLWDLRQAKSQIKWQIHHPPEDGNLRFIMMDSYAESSNRPGGRSSGTSTHQKMAIWDSHW